MPAIEILFKVGGLPELQSAIGGVQGSLDKMSKSAAAVGAASANARIASEKRVLSEVEKSAKLESKALTDAAKGVEKAHLASEREKTAATKREAAQRAKDVDKYIRDQRAVNDYDAREFEKNEQAKTRVAKAEAAKRKETISTIAGGAGKLIGGAASRTIGMVGRAATGLALAGGFAVADSLRTGIKEQEMAGVIFRGAAERGSFKGPADVQQMARETAIKTGMTSTQVLGGLDRFVRITGSLKDARDLMTDLGKVASATGTNFEDIANIAAEIQTKTGDSGKTMETVLAIASQGKTGAIDIKDLHEYGTRLAASGLLYQGDVSKNIISIGAIAQMGKRFGGADVAQATMATERYASDAAKHGKAVQQKYGINLFTDDTHTVLRGMDETIPELIKATHGDIGALHGVFQERAYRAVSGFQTAYARAAGPDLGSKDKKLSEAAHQRGVAAMDEALLAARGAPMTMKDVEKDNAARLLEVQAKINVAMEQFHEKINSQLLPLLPDLIDKFTKLIPAIESVIEFFTNGSLTGGLSKLIGVIFAAELMKGGLSALAGQGVAKLLGMVGMSLFGKTAATGAVGVAEQLLLPGVGGAAAAVGGAEAVGGGGAAAGGMALGGAAAMIGVAIAAGLAVGYGVDAWDKHQKDKGSARIRGVLDMSAGTTEEKRMKLEKIEDEIAHGRSQRHWVDAALRGKENDELSLGERKSALDPKYIGASAALDQLRKEALELSTALGEAANAANTFKLSTGEVVHPKGPSGDWNREATQ